MGAGEVPSYEGALESPACTLALKVMTRLVYLPGTVPLQKWM